MPKHINRTLVFASLTRTVAERVAVVTRVRAKQDKPLGTVHVVDVIEAGGDYFAIRIRFNEYVQPHDLAFYKGFVEGAIAYAQNSWE